MSKLLWAILGVVATAPLSGCPTLSHEASVKPANVELEKARTLLGEEEETPTHRYALEVDPVPGGLRIEAFRELGSSGSSRSGSSATTGSAAGPSVPIE